MPNSLVIANDTKTIVKSEMLKQLWLKKETTPDSWERAVFQSFTKQTREDIDWDFEDNHAGYYTWIKSFDGLIEELIGDGYVTHKKTTGQYFLASEDVNILQEYVNTFC